MEIDKERSCYTCGGFGHMARHCRNQRRGRVADRRRLEYGGKVQGKLRTFEQFKRGGESRIPQLYFHNRFNVLAKTMQVGTKELEGRMEVRKVEGKPLREVTVKIGLERIDTQEEITEEALLDSRATGLVMSSEFAQKQGFKLKKLERPMHVRNVDGSLNKKGPIEHTVEVNIYYQGHRERMEIDVIGEQR